MIKKASHKAAFVEDDCLAFKVLTNENNAREQECKYELKIEWQQKMVRD